MAIPGWMTEQQDLIASLIEENRILRERSGSTRTLPDANQKSHLAAVAKVGLAL
jgi:hypothetical protein